MSEPANTPGKAAAGMRRRAFLGGGAGVLLAAGLPGLLRARDGAGTALARAARAGRFRRALPIPRVITDADISIPIRQARVRVLPGKRTRMWTYDGTFPGPTIRRMAGQETRVTFTHRLGRRAGELTVHLHGGHTPSDDDGQPGGLTAAQPRSLYCDISPGLSAERQGNDLLIAPGDSRTYTYPLTEAGEQERACFQWYHDHRLERTARNIWRGLAGMWILDDDVDRPGGPLGLPEGPFDVPLMIADRSFDGANQLTNPFRGLRPPRDGAVGSRILVNGAHRPHLSVKPRRYRFRILNASSFRSYNLALSNGAKLTQIATEAGLMPERIRRPRILVGPGERVEVVIDFAALRGRRVRLVSERRTDDPRGIGTSAFRGDLMEFRVASTVVEDLSTVPRALRALPDWTAGLAESPPAKDFTWTVTVSGGISPRWLINGSTFDPDRVETQATVGEVVVWELRNRTAAAHMMHLHHTDWYLLRRNGKLPPPWERCLKETFFMDPHERILIAGRPSDHLGKFVVHCHMLEHEDHGLMSQFEVVAP